MTAKTKRNPPVLPEYLLKSRYYYAVLIDKDGHLIHFNEAFEKLIGPFFLKSKNSTFTQIVAPEYREAFNNLFNYCKAYGSGNASLQLNVSEPPNAPVLHWEFCNHTLSESGWSGVLCIGHLLKNQNADIPETSAGEDEKSYLRAIIDNTLDNVVLMDKNYKVLCFNEVIKNSLIAFRGREIQIGDDYRDFVVPHLMDLFLESHQKALEGEYVVVEAATEANHISIWFRFKVNPVYNPTGNFVGVTLTATNIDERKRAEIRLINSEEKFRKIIDSASNPILIVGKNMRIRMVNPETESVFGYTSQELHNQKIDMLFPLRMQNRLQKFKSDYIHNPGPVKLGTGEYIPARKKNGAELIIEANINSFELEDETFILIILQDITHRILTEQKLKKNNRELTLLNKINDLILRTDSEAAIFNDICKCLITSGGYKLAWIGRKPYKSENSDFVVHVNSYGETSYIENIKIPLSVPAESMGPTASALMHRTTQITNNVETSENFKPWLNIAKKYGIGSSIVIPLPINKDDQYCLNIYSDRIDAFDEIEVAILERLAANLIKAIKNLRTKQEVERVQYLLKERIKELTTIYRITKILQKGNPVNSDILNRIVCTLPAGYQYPDVCEAKIIFDERGYCTPNYRPSNFKQTADFHTRDGKKGYIEVLYTAEKPEEFEGPFLREERALLDTIAEMIVKHYDKNVVYDMLKKSEANLKSVFENTQVGYVLLDVDLNIISMNTRFYEGYNLATGIKLKLNDNFLNKLLPGKRDILSKAIESVNSTMKAIEYDTQYIRNQSTYYFNLGVVPIIDKSVTIGYCLSAMDVTSRKTMEMERIRMMDDLIQRNRNLEQFSYIVSHNIRAPLTNILGLEELLRLDLDEETRETTLHEIRNSAKQLDQVIKDLNDILKVRQEITEIKSEVCFDKLIKDVSQGISNIIKTKNVQIQTDFSQSPCLHSVRSYMQSIFHNLITNSIKYARTGIPAEIRIHTEKKNGQVIIHFRDNGSGIDLKKYGGQIFGLYKRFHPGVEGKGMGLFMVKTQIEAINGSIDIQSEPGKGTSFTITFPE